MQDHASGKANLASDVNSMEVADVEQRAHLKLIWGRFFDMVLESLGQFQYAESPKPKEGVHYLCSNWVYTIVV